MKSRFKHSLNLLLVASALMLTACGKKENKVNSSGVAGSSPFYSGNPAFNGTGGSTIINQVNSIKSNVTCLNGSYRLTNDVSFYVQGGYANGTNTIYGNFTEGFLTSGTINQLYVGVSIYRDLMFVTQVTNGGQIVGYNVTLSFCEMKNTSPTLPSIISNERKLSGFRAPWGINIGTKTSCGYGLVYSTGVGYDNYGRPKATTIISEKNPSNPYSANTVEVPTSFAAPTCNGSM